MSSLDRNTSGPKSADTILTVGCSIVVVALFAVTGAWVIGYKLDGRETSGMLGQLIAGTAVWPAEATYILAGLAVLLIAASVCVALLRRKSGTTGEQLRIDAAAQHMATPREVRPLTEKGRAKSARRALIETPLLPMMGCNVNGGDLLYVGPEMITTLIAGPRGGKSSSFSKPVICEHRGPVVVTENKPNLAAETRRFREQFGRAWVFDPQRIAREPVSWYWNPIGYVTHGGDEQLTDMRALKLAQRFSFSTGFGKGKDYFDISAQGLVGALILAAAVMGHDIFAVRTWLSNPNDRTPANALSGAYYSEAAAALNGIMSLTSKQRDGVYGTADTMTNFLMYRAVREWVTPGNRRIEFDPASFVRSTGDTLYLLSREGQGSMGPIVAALTVAVAEAAEDHAGEQPNGRLRTPIAFVLDEVANVCKWAELPQVVSHYGSKGILVFAIFQSWSQGVNVWGDHGMKALWSASSLRIIGSGIAENGFLSSVSGMIGSFRKKSVSTSRNRQGLSTSVSYSKEEILSVADLTAIPTGRAIFVHAGVRPILVKLVPWWERDYAEKLRESESVPAPSQQPPSNGVRSYSVPLTDTAPQQIVQPSRWATRR